jgi:hypothetical protein
MSKWITTDDYETIEPGTRLLTRFMGKAEAVAKPDKDEEVLVKFTDGPWKDRELHLIRQQISRLLL